MTIKERREYSRTKVDWPVSLHTALGIIMGNIKDISLGGALIQTRQLPNLDEPFEIRIDVPEYAFPILTTVERVRLTVYDIDDPSPTYDLAVQFLEMPEDDERSLCNVLERTALRYQSPRTTSKKTASDTIDTGVLSAMEQLSRDLKRPFKDLLDEAMQDFVRKYKNKSSQI
jgi:hypothetical protein